ncbi:hypothetical protein [Streptomyces sp. NBC_01003]|uniref:hypothetical protein n=1 Tax=Streptomyces sp. NBC_01003 TaxID=2903714 RepID=UPI00386E1F0D
MGIWYHAYVITDIFSRCIIGHTVELAEAAERAEGLIRETIECSGIVPHTVHADCGTSMTRGSRNTTGSCTARTGYTSSAPRPLPTCG